MASIMIDAEQVKSITAESIGDGGTSIEFKNGHYLFVDPGWSMICKELEAGPVILIEL